MLRSAAGCEPRWSWTDEHDFHTFLLAKRGLDVLGLAQTVIVAVEVGDQDREMHCPHLE